MSSRSISAGIAVTVRVIANNDLTLADIPPADADWEAIEWFALTYDGYKECGSFEACAELANSRRHRTLADLRACLFFEQRRWRHFGWEPDEEALAYIRDIVEQIRTRIDESPHELSTPDVWDQVRQLEGKTLATLHQDNPFTVVAVLDDGLRVRPESGSGAERKILRARIEHIAGLKLCRDEILWRVRKLYPDSRNTSYIAAIAFALSDTEGRKPLDRSGQN